MKEKARQAQLWNLWIPADLPHGARLTNVEYAFFAEITGRWLMAVRPQERTVENLCISLGCVMLGRGVQLQCAGYWQYGGFVALWIGKATAPMVGPIAQWRDSILFWCGKQQMRIVVLIIDCLICHLSFVICRSYD